MGRLSPGPQPYPPMKLLFTWNPPRGLDRIRSCVKGIEIETCGERGKIPSVARDAEVLCVGHFDAEILGAAKKLRWVHAFSAGVEGFLFPEMKASGIPLTCLKGCFDIAAAEHALGAMINAARTMDRDLRDPSASALKKNEPTELYGKTVGILGFGSMGAGIARLCRAFGMKVIGLARSARPAPADVDEWLAPTEIPRLLRESDFVVVAVPLTSDTRGLIGDRELHLMKPSAWLVDVSGRPAIYDLDALGRVLESGVIAGAHMQIVPAQDSPLWKLERLRVPIHRVVSREQYDRCVQRFCENLRRFQRQEPLLGLVDKQAGY